MYFYFDLKKNFFFYFFLHLILKRTESYGWIITYMFFYIKILCLTKLEKVLKIFI